MTQSLFPNRRRFLQFGTAAASSLAAPALIAADASRPVAAQGLQFGDPVDGSVLVWSRSDRAARLLVDWSLDRSFAQSTRIVGAYALPDSDFTVRQDLAGLPDDREVFVRVSFQSLANDRALSEPVLGRFITPPAARGHDDDNGWHRGRRGLTDLRFVWGGDTAGQGWGINPAFGGMKIYESMRQRQPRFFIHSGDTIYADGPIPASVVAEGGRVWQNIVTPEVSKVA
jgi:alkaline phosphatase D